MATLAGFPRLLNYATNTCLRHISPASIHKQYCPALTVWEPRAYFRSKTEYGSKNRVIRRKLPWMPEIPDYQIQFPEDEKEKEKMAADVVKEINKQITTDMTGRLFAVVHLTGTQFKVTESDIIIVLGVWPPNPGDQLKLEKVLLVGGKDFTLVGRPILNRELVTVDATVIQKTLSHTITRFRFKPRRQYRRINFFRVYQTMLRINSIKINGEIDKLKEVEGLDKIF